MQESDAGNDDVRKWWVHIRFGDHNDGDCPWEDVLGIFITILIKVASVYLIALCRCCWLQFIYGEAASPIYRPVYCQYIACCRSTTGPNRTFPSQFTKLDGASSETQPPSGGGIIENVRHLFSNDADKRHKYIKYMTCALNCERLSDRSDTPRE